MSKTNKKKDLSKQQVDNLGFLAYISLESKLSRLFVRFEEFENQNIKRQRALFFGATIYFLLLVSTVLIINGLWFPTILCYLLISYILAIFIIIVQNANKKT